MSYRGLAYNSWPEGEIFDRDSVQSSLRQQFGLGTDGRRILAAERAIAEMMVDLHRNFSDPLTNENLSIHPFEDGNGRIGRALVEKSLAQSLSHPTLIALAYTIERSRKAYYGALERNNKDIAITHWLTYFAQTILDAQGNTIKRLDFYVEKAKLYEKLRGRLNERQEKAIARLFRAGVDGFKGGLSAENYISITRTSRATASRDLQDLVEKGALTRTGELRHTRYHLNISDQPKG